MVKRQMILYDDILAHIINMLDSDSCIMMARTCHHIHDLVHCVRKCVTMTDNIFEAVRCGSLLSFTHIRTTHNRALMAASMRGITTDMLLHIHNCTNDDEVAYYLCKRGILVEVSVPARLRALMLHAIAHDKHELLKYIESSGYVLTAGNEQDERYERGIKQLKRTIKKDDVKIYTSIVGSYHRSAFILYNAIRYNAINIVLQHAQDVNEIARYIWLTRTCDMTLEMAELLLRLTNNHENIVHCIVGACNYRLTEMLREKGLYNKKLVMRSSHNEFS